MESVDSATRYFSVTKITGAQVPVVKFEKRSEPGEAIAPIDPGLGSRLKDRRKVLGKTQQQVAEEASLTVGFISQIERGISTPSLASLFNLAKALETTVDQFVSDSPAHKHSVVTHSGQRQPYKAGGTSRKVFKWKELSLAPKEVLDISISQVIRDFTTRKHYPGFHRIDLMVNGETMAESGFELLP